MGEVLASSFMVLQAKLIWVYWEQLPNYQNNNELEALDSEFDLLLVALVDQPHISEREFWLLQIKIAESGLTTILGDPIF